MKWIKSLLLAVLLFTFGMTIQVNAAEETYEELSWEKKHELLTNAALKYDIPPEILKAIAMAENKMNQFDENGHPIVSGDDGIGMMQITNTDFDFDKQKLKTDTAYNIEAGARVLNNKWNKMKAGTFPVINGADNRHIIEQWYYPIMAYNGIANRNNPDNEDRVKPTYQQEVFSIIEENSLVQIADTPEQFEFGLDDNGKLHFKEMAYSWDEADSHSTQMFQEGDKVYALNDGDAYYGNFRDQKEMSNDPSRRIPYYTELEITGGPYFLNSTQDNHFVTYQVEGVNFSGFMASSNLRPIETLPSGFGEENPREDVAIDKTWEIEMNTSIDSSTVHPRNVYMVREDGMGIRADISLDGNFITVKPQQDYMPGQTYTLYIKDLKSTRGIEMESKVSMTFQVEEPYQESMKKENVVLKASMNKKYFSEGDQIQVTGSIENQGEVSFVYHGSGTLSRSADLYFFIQQDGELIHFVGRGDLHPSGWTMDWVEHELKAGVRKTSFATFDLSVQNFMQEGTPIYDAPKGEYTLLARYGSEFLLEMPFVIE
ncbi:transglycosylase SLT domain-containing protein [Pontibacillus sp. ALD_SL1]|uniref:transglycosylase SLT domain-containing protein n=1 Tax=Pontibacillus sp. ALD_SL1 TaxID=2777185 RepID=UPI001A965620|nr:transglycosylase SLT domain-containing protein [Pontibacillus sp. ALD_SL1]QSS98772.1 transglycosylase SLT domain-containing protein [Pontibacillus sp. ALD_SL1]